MRPGSHAEFWWRGELRLLVLPFLITTLTACASRGQDVVQMGGETRSVFLTVQNDNYWDATIHANWGGGRERLGFVVGKTTETFTFDWRRDDVQFDVAFIGDGGWRSDVVNVYPGDHLDLTILPGPMGRRAPGIP